MDYLYLIHCVGTKYYKIGISANPIERLVALQLCNPIKLELLMTFGFSSRQASLEAEAWAHKGLSKYAVRGEWFALEDDVLLQVKQDFINLS